MVAATNNTATLRIILNGKGGVAFDLGALSISVFFLLFLCREENRWIIQETLSLRTVHTDVGSDPELLFRIVFVVCPVSEDVSRSLLLSVGAVISCVDVPSETVRPVCRPH